MRQTALPFIILLLLIPADLLAFALFSQAPEFYIISLLFTAVFSLLAALAAFLVFRFHGFQSIQGKAFFCMFAGSISWLAAETAWVLMEIVYEETIPLISLADPFYYLGYILFLGGFYYAWKATRTSETIKLGIVVFFAATLLLIGASFGYLFENISSPDMNITEKLVTIGYSFFDFILISSGICLIIFMKRNKIALAWTIIITGFLFSAIGDVLYAQFPFLYVSGNYTDLLWQISYIMTALGCVLYYNSVSKLIIQPSVNRGGKNEP